MKTTSRNSPTVRTGARGAELPPPCQAAPLGNFERTRPSPTRPKLPALVWAIILSTVLPVVITGCGSTKVSSENKASVGQQLMDLDKARQDGAITQKEYDRLKKAIIQKND